MKNQNKIYIALAFAAVVVLFGLIAIIFRPKSKLNKVVSNIEKNLNKEVKEVAKSKNFFIRTLNKIGTKFSKFFNFFINTRSKKIITIVSLTILTVSTIAIAFNNYSYIDSYVFNAYNKLYLTRTALDLVKIATALTETKDLSEERITKIKARLETYNNKLVTMLKTLENVELKQNVLSLISTVNKLLLNNCYSK